MPTKREIEAALRLHAAVAEMRAIHGQHLTEDSLEWIAEQTLKSNPTLEPKDPKKCRKKFKKSPAP